MASLWVVKISDLIYSFSFPIFKILVMILSNNFINENKSILGAKMEIWTMTWTIIISVKLCCLDRKSALSVENV